MVKISLDICAGYASVIVGSKLKSKVPGYAMGKQDLVGVSETK